MRRLILLCLLIFPAGFIHAQKNYHDKIILKNDSVISGTIIKQILNEKVLLVSDVGDTLTVKSDEISKITKEAVQGKNAQFYRGKWESTGYQLVIEGGGGVAVDEFEKNYSTLTFINGIRFNKHYFLGFGIGFIHYRDTEQKNISPDLPSYIFPLSIDFMVTMPFSLNTAAYLGVSTGYSLQPHQKFGWETDSQKGKIEGRGPFLNPSAGITIRFGEEANIHLGTGYNMQYGEFIYHYKLYNHDVSKQVSKFAGSVCITGGITF